MQTETSMTEPGWGSLQFVTTDILHIGYYELGRGPVVVLLHGFPYDVHAYIEVAPIVAAAGHRVIVPYLRGFGATTYRDRSTLRSAEQAALASDVIDLLDSLGIPHCVVGGFDWGARAACAAAALWPERCRGLVSAGGYLIQDVSSAASPAHPDQESVLWYQYYFLTERGRAGLVRYRRELARKLWHDWSPSWNFDDAVFERTATAFDNPDWVDTVLHSYRYRHAATAGDPRYATLAQKLTRLPPITVPTVSVVAGSRGRADSAIAQSGMFHGPWTHRVLSDVGHNLPQERPSAFAAALLALDQMLR